jgi:hypothetical protein
MTESGTVRIRLLAVPAVALLAAAGLTGCRSNIGTALVVDGHSYSDSQISRYVTPSAKPVQGQSSSTPPRTFVVQILINTRLGRKLVDSAAPGQTPTKGELAAIRQRVLAGKSPKSYVESQKVTGYTASFDSLIVDFVTYQTILSTLAQNGVYVQSKLASVKISVKVSPRYGRWDAKSKSLDTSDSAGLPAFVSLQPSGAAGAGAQMVPVPEGN